MIVINKGIFDFEYGEVNVTEDANGVNFDFSISQAFITSHVKDCMYKFMNDWCENNFPSCEKIRLFGNIGCAI